MTVKSRTRIFSSHGQPVLIGAKVGEGGEGAVFEVPDQRDVVAKLYHKQIDAKRAAKLSAMASLPSEKISRAAAWPLDTLHVGDHSGTVIGFLMPKISGYKPIHTLYGPKSRRAEFPDATWLFLVHAAANVARAVDNVHDHGVVIGDINHANIVVSNDAIVKLIDCDSFQFTANSTQYLCEVGVETHTPPELQGRSFREVVRTPNHDAFGLAVVIFQLLFLGRHPFSGTYLGSGDIPIDQAIREFRFAYGSSARSHQMAQPLNTLPLAIVSPPVAALFERAFSLKGVGDRARPTPNEWLVSLEELKKACKRCSHSNAHYYPTTLTMCPLCEVEKASGAILFNFTSIVTAQARSEFNLQAVWAQIVAVPSPGPLPTVRRASAFNASASKRAAAIRLKRDVRLTGGLVIIAIGLVIAISVGGSATWWIIGVVAIIAYAIIRSGDGQAATEIRKNLEDAQTRLKNIEARWSKDAGPDRFDSMLRELGEKKNRYEGLKQVRQRRFRQLHAQARDRQMQRFLDLHRILDAEIPGIGPARVAMLQSYGIETAADVTEADVFKVPGFGPVRTRSLLDWRRAIEQRFVFDPSRGVDPSDIQAIDREISFTRMRLEDDLRRGPDMLRQVSQQVVSVREAVGPELEAARQDVDQAKADLMAIS